MKILNFSAIAEIVIINQIFYLNNNVNKLQLSLVIDFPTCFLVRFMHIDRFI